MTILPAEIPKRSKLRSEYNMGEYDFERFHQILKIIDEYGFRVKMNDINAIQPYLAAMKQLFINLRCYMVEPTRRLLDDLFAEIENELYNISRKKSNQIPKLLIEALEDINIKLIEVKQFIGLGILVSRQFSAKTKLRKAMGV